MNGKSWHMMEDESPKSYEAFEVYYILEPGERSAKAVAHMMGRPEGYKKVLEVWSSKYQWVQRAKDHDAYQRKLKRDKVRAAEDAQLEARLAAIEKARGVFIDRAEELALTLIEHTVDPDSTSPNVRATIEALNRAGVTVPQEIQLRVAGLGKRVDEDKHKDMSDAELTQRLRSKMGSS